MLGAGSALSRRWARPRERGSTGAAAAPGTGSARGAPRDWTLDPSGDWYYWWISIVALPVLYNCIVLVCRSCFPALQERHARLWLSLDCACDGIYLLDIGVRLHTAFVEDGILVRDRGRIRRRYLRSSAFPWDVAAVLPTDLLWLRLGTAVPAVRANRCLRAPRLFEAFDRRETRTAHPNAFRVAKLMLYVFIAIHWYGCLYFALSSRLGLGADAWVCPNASRPGFARPLRQYLHSFYFSTLILATVGDTPEPRREEEFLFVIAGFLLAVLGFATITGSISSVISNVNAADAAFYPDPEPVFGPGEFVCRRGDVGHEMYFIREGRLAVVAEDGVTQLAVLGEGLYFGEISLINIKGNTSGNRRTANIMSIGYSDLFCLSKEDLAEVLVEFPSARAALEAKGRELLLRMGKLDLRAEAAAAAAEEEAERRVLALEMALEGLQTRAARLLAQLESSAFKLALRVQRLEGRLRRRRRAGTKGPTGGQGPATPGHPAGAQGPAGEPTPTRAQGLTGLEGPSGAQGPPRSQGPSGAQGPTKSQGPKGVQGPPTSQGPKEVQGPNKAQGSPRAQGPTGAQVPPGLRVP
ncbi:hypothetical protein Q9966_011530 [Columba livia]|nr:hypothetical protein Q9966_011530 [Columba livia]